MQIDVGPVHVDLAFGHASRGRARRRSVGSPHGGVGDDDDITVQPISALGKKARQVRRPRLLLTFDEQLHGDGGCRSTRCGSG